MKQRIRCFQVFVLLFASVDISSGTTTREIGTTLRRSKKEYKTFNAHEYHNVSEKLDLDLSGEGISDLEDFTFQNFTKLLTLNIEENGLRRISQNAFHGLSSLKKLKLGMNSLETLPMGVFDPLTSLSTLSLENNRLQEIPKFGGTTTVALLDIRNNPVKHLEANSLKEYKSLARLYLSGTEIKYLQNDVFKYNVHLTELHVNTPSLEKIEENAFRGPQYLTELSLQSTRIKSLPQKGLEWVLKLNIKDVKNLWQIPVRAFRKLDTVELTYSFHCCLLRSMRDEETSFNGNFTTCEPPPPPIPAVGTTLFTETTASTRLPNMFGRIKDILNTSNVSFPSRDASSNNRGSSNVIFTLPNLLCPTNPPEFISQKPKPKISCTPQPDAFNPCENVMGSDPLRVCVWIVVIFAITGNLFKLLVILTNGHKMSIAKIVMSSLGFANLCMGVYLAMLAVEDLVTLGEYQNYVRSWQYGPGCKAAGFLSIFSTELAAYTLTVITVERYYTIVYALKQERYLTLKQIIVLMIIGWLFAIIVAALPLLPYGISSYSKVAICLPFDVRSDGSKAYVTIFLVTNGLAFFIVLYCYAKMYCSLGTSCSSATRVESRVARRMALLVFVNFACWFPIALLALIAIYGEALIEVDTSKFLLVFIYPINSLTNPYLYALSTKSFRIDAFNLLGRCGICRRKMTMMSNVLKGEVEGVPTLSSRALSASKSSLNSNRIGGFSPSGTPKIEAIPATSSKYQYSTKDKTSYYTLTEWSEDNCGCIRKPKRSLMKHLKVPTRQPPDKEENRISSPVVCLGRFSPEADYDSSDSLKTALNARKTKAASIFIEGISPSNGNLISRLRTSESCNDRRSSNEPVVGGDTRDNDTKSEQSRKAWSGEEESTSSNDSRQNQSIIMISSC